MKHRILDKSVYLLSGDTDKFIEDLATGLPTQSQNAFLDKFGKLIALCDQIQTVDGLYLIVERYAEEQFVEHMKTYVPLSNVKLRKTNLKAVFFTQKPHLKLIIETRGGWIALVEHPPIGESFSDEEFQRIRVENNLSIQGIDFEHPMFLETNWEDVINWKKGCYLGQEIMARVNTYGKPPRKLVRKDDSFEFVKN
jgi:folate-binding protein YgfZ